jgi:membrane protein insertase Oxa1/YidC/SpoIIIJ
MAFAKWPSEISESECLFSIQRRRNQVMGNKMFWAFLWVIGIPLPVVVVLYMIFGGGCS